MEQPRTAEGLNLLPLNHEMPLQYSLHNGTQAWTSTFPLCYEHAKTLNVPHGFRLEVEGFAKSCVKCENPRFQLCSNCGEEIEPERGDCLRANLCEACLDSAI